MNRPLSAGQINDVALAPVHEASPTLYRKLYTLKIFTRTCLALVWVLEGLIPKIFAVLPREVDLVRRSGLFLVNPEITLAGLGVLEVVFGVLLLFGIRERVGAVISTGAMVILSVMVIWLDPSAFSDPYGGIIKHTCLLSAAAVIWVLSPLPSDGFIQKAKPGEEGLK